jgi:hypothetical protein
MTRIVLSVPMSDQNIRVRGAIATSSLGLAILSGGAILAPAQDLNLKPGLWELTATYESENDPMNMISAAQKAQMEQAKAHMSHRSRGPRWTPSRRPSAPCRVDSNSRLESLLGRKWRI